MMVLRPSLPRHLLLLLLGCVLLLTGQCQAAEQTRKCPKLRVRREWRKLSPDERADWIGAVKCLGSIHHQRLSLSKEGTFLIDERPSLYDDFAYAHAAMENSSHITPYFLSWHRWFLNIFDNSLRQSCGYTGTMPYWDWSQDHFDLMSAPVFDSDPTHGLGGGGDCTSSPSSDCNIYSGALSLASSTPFNLLYPIPHILRRNLSLYTGELGPNEKPQNATLSPENIQHAMQRSTPGDFYLFQHIMTQMHNHVHNFVGGDLSGTCPNAIPDPQCTGSYTPNDPIFWLHHGQLDRLWSNWQLQHPDNFEAFSGTPLHPSANNTHWKDLKVNATVIHQMFFDRLSVPVHVSEVFNHSEPPFCYRYEDP